MIKVLYFIHGLNMGGAETLVKNYALMLDKKKFEVIVLCFDKVNSPYDAVLSDAGIKVLYICNQMPYYGRRGFLYRVINHVMRYSITRKIIHQIAPDIIHIHLPINSYIKYSKPKKETALVYTQHFAAQRWKEKYPRDIVAMRWLIKCYTMQIIALNETMKAEINRYFSVDSTIVLNNGINLKHFRNTRNRKEMRKELGIPEMAFVVGHVGRFDPIKNHMFLIEVFRKVRQRDENTWLLLVGEGSMENEVREKLKGYDLLRYTVILHNREDIPDIFKAMDWMIFPSVSEGLGIAVIEAQVAGVRCLVSDSVSEATRVSNLVFYLSLQESPETWAEAILNREMPKPIYYGLDKWDIKNVIYQLENIYIELVSGIESSG